MTGKFEQYMNFEGLDEEEGGMTEDEYENLMEELLHDGEIDKEKVIKAAEKHKEHIPNIRDPSEDL